MDDLSEKLAGLLNDPESMNRVRQMAESLLGEQSEPEQTPAPVPPAAAPGLSDLLNAQELGAVMKLITRMKNDTPDSRVQLLTALRPHLSDPKREKLDTAVKILRLLDLLPLIKESGLLGQHKQS